MGKKKMKFPFLFKSSKNTTATTTSAAADAAWPWPICTSSPNTPSFRENTTTPASFYKTLNAAFVDDDHYKNTAEISSETTDSVFSIRRDESFSSASEIPDSPSVEESAIILGLRSDRLFFEPGETNSILEEAKSHGDFACDQSADLMAVDSRDPFFDFRVSMEEMVEAHGARDWGFLEELLACYLRVNPKSNHGYIVGAFVDLLLQMAMETDDVSGFSSSAIDEPCSSSSNAIQLSFSSPSFSSSTYSSISPRFSLIENGDGIIIEKNVNASSSSSSSSSCSLCV